MSPPTAGKGNLVALARSILSLAETIEADCEARGVAPPSLDEPFNPTIGGINHDDPKTLEAVHKLTSAAAQLANTVRPLALTLVAPVGGVSSFNLLDDTVSATLLTNGSAMYRWCLPRRCELLLNSTSLRFCERRARRCAFYLDNGLSA